jgi:hypothetical protein
VSQGIRYDLVISSDATPDMAPASVKRFCTGKELDMSRKQFSPEQIIAMLREAEVLLSQGTQVAEASRKLEAKEQTCHLCLVG